MSDQLAVVEAERSKVRQHLKGETLAALEKRLLFWRNACSLQRAGVERQWEGNTETAVERQWKAKETAVKGQGKRQEVRMMSVSLSCSSVSLSCSHQQEPVDHRIELCLNQPDQRPAQSTPRGSKSARTSGTGRMAPKR